MRAARYGIANNEKHGGMEDALMDFVSATESRDAALMETTTADANLTTQLRHQEDQIRSLQADMCNIKVLTAVKTTGDAP